MRLIDADAPLDCVQERLRILKRKTARLSDIVAEVNTQPTVTERTAENVVSPTAVGDSGTCSACGKQFVPVWDKYCPNCGARFEGADR